LEFNIEKARLSYHQWRRIPAQKITTGGEKRKIQVSSGHPQNSLSKKYFAAPLLPG
jgi:hypothetical protein